MAANGSAGYGRLGDPDGEIHELVIAGALGVVRPPEAAGREDCEDHPPDAERVGYRLAYHRVRESARVVSLRLGRVRARPAT